MMQQNSHDPLTMLRNMWTNMGFGLPGVVVPTFDADELEKRITDLKAVEGWLSMNLSMLQMTIRNLEMQVSTIRAVKTMGEMATNAAATAAQTGTDSFNAVAESLKAAAAARAEGEPAPAPAADGAGEPQAGAMWPWGLMQQVQEYMQRQADAATAMTEAVTEAVSGENADKTTRSRKKRKTE